MSSSFPLRIRLAGLSAMLPRLLVVSNVLVWWFTYTFRFPTHRCLCRFALTTWMYNSRDTALETLTERIRAQKQDGKFDARRLLAAIDADMDDNVS
eukprot:scaffold83553_cov25-Tisochrysis_lutea.AAC.2